MIKYLKRTIKDRSIKTISGLEIGCWVDVIDPSSEEIEYLVKKFQLDERNLESGMDQNEIPHIDFVNGNIYFFAKNVPARRKKEIETYLIVISKRFILTLSKTESDFIKEISEGKINFVTTQKLKCLIRLFSLMNESFERLTVEEVKTVQIGRKSFTELEEKQINTLLEQEDILNNLVSAYYYMNLLYERAIRRIKFLSRIKKL